MFSRNWSALQLLLCLGFACSCSSTDEACEFDRDCLPGDLCIDGVCYRDSPDGGTDADAGQDDAGQDDAGQDDAGQDGSDGQDGQEDGGSDLDADGASEDGGDTGSDEGGDPPPPPAWLIQPGLGLGDLKVSQGMDSAHSLQEVQTALQADGAACDAGDYTLAFLEDTLRATGIEVDDSDVFDGADHVIALTARAGLDARTVDGLAPGSSLAEVLAMPNYASPDHVAAWPDFGPTGGGKLAMYFSKGIFVNFDESDVATAVIVTRPLVPSTGILDPVAGTLQMAGHTFDCGDGLIGSSRNEHRNRIGMPDWAYSFIREVQTTEGPVDIRFYIDSYRMMGLEFIGGEQLFVSGLIAVVLYPLFYGATAAGHGVGSSKAEWETELDAPVNVKQDPAYDGTLYVYAAGMRHFGIVYTDDGAEDTDQATLLVLNYLQASE